MKNYKTYTSEDFIHDGYFIEWVKRPDSENSQFWKEIIDQYPEKEKEINIAYSILKSFLPVSEDISKEEINDLCKMIEKSTIRKVTFFNRYRFAAASVLILFAIIGSWWLYRTFSPSYPEIDYTQLNRPSESKNEVSLILADERQLIISEEEANLIYNQGGKLTINSTKQIDQPINEITNSKLLLNQIIVPFGKRSAITLSDGTKLWINSGSRAIYPIEFDTKKREIYIEGEVYLDVAKDENKPFIIKTGKMDINVLGTSFNVSSYPDDQIVTIVLVTGSIKIKPEKQKEIQVLPNHALVFSKQTQAVTLNRVDIYNYISWKDGWLRCDSEEIGSVVSKLSRYYDKKFVFEDQSIKSLHLSGKLDLKENFEEVLRVVSLTAPIKFNVENDKINVSYINNN